MREKERSRDGKHLESGTGEDGTEMLELRYLVDLTTIARKCIA
jgi:hypothetical protein